MVQPVDEKTEFEETQQTSNRMQTRDMHAFMQLKQNRPSGYISPGDPVT